MTLIYIHAYISFYRLVKLLIKQIAIYSKFLSKSLMLHWQELSLLIVTGKTIS